VSRTYRRSPRACFEVPLRHAPVPLHTFPTTPARGIWRCVPLAIHSRSDTSRCGPAWSSDVGSVSQRRRTSSRGRFALRSPAAADRLRPVRTSRSYAIVPVRRGAVAAGAPDDAANADEADRWGGLVRGEHGHRTRAAGRKARGAAGRHGFDGARGRVCLMPRTIASRRRCGAGSALACRGVATPSVGAPRDLLRREAEVPVTARAPRRTRGRARQGTFPPCNAITATFPPIGRPSDRAPLRSGAPPIGRPSDRAPLRSGDTSAGTPQGRAARSTSGTRQDANLEGACGGARRYGATFRSIHAANAAPAFVRSATVFGFVSAPSGSSSVATFPT